MTRLLPRLRPLEVLRLADEASGPSYLLRDPEGFSEEELVLSEGALFVAAHFDGEHTLAQTRDAFQRRFGKLPGAREIELLETRLEDVHFLETEAFHRRVEELVAEFEREPVRPAVHAGICYPEDPEEAVRAVAGFFEEAQTLEEPGDRPEGVLRGLVAPHIDLRVGGPCSAVAYSLLAEAEGVDTVVVLGTAHACPHASWIVSAKPFDTPLGQVPVDLAACERLARASGAAQSDHYFHRREHSIEFQALFLAALRTGGRNLRMVPVLCGSLRGMEADGEPAAGDAGVATEPRDLREDPFLLELRHLLNDLGGRAVVVAGADLAHVGPRFGDSEILSPHHLSLLESRDRASLARVGSGDARGFRASVLEAGDPRRICGLSPIYGLLRALPGVRGKVLKYEQASDETGTVSYASMGLWG